MSALPERVRELRRPLERLRDEINEAIERLGLSLRDESDEERALATGSVERRRFLGPPVDVEENDNEVVVRAELPGVSPDDVNVEVSPDRIVLRGEKVEQRLTGARGVYRIERRFGGFRRVVELPTEIDPEKAEADYRDGVLNITLPKSESSRSRHVQINVAD